MQTVLLVIHIMVAAALVALVLWQKSEGGALGIGGGGGGFMTGRGTANLLTRATAMLAAGFFATSILLTLIAPHAGNRGSVLDAAQPAQAVPGSGGTPQSPAAPEAPRGGILDKLN